MLKYLAGTILVLGILIAVLVPSRAVMSVGQPPNPTLCSELRAEPGGYIAEQIACFGAPSVRVGTDQRFLLRVGIAGAGVVLALLVFAVAIPGRPQAA